MQKTTSRTFIDSVRAVVPRSMSASGNTAWNGLVAGTSSMDGNRKTRGSGWTWRVDDDHDDKISVMNSCTMIVDMI